MLGTCSAHVLSSAYTHTQYTVHPYNAVQILHIQLSAVMSQPWPFLLCCVLPAADLLIVTFLKAFLITGGLCAGRLVINANTESSRESEASSSLCHSLIQEARRRKEGHLTITSSSICQNKSFTEIYKIL